MVPNTEGEVAEGETVVAANEAEDHAELAVGWRQVSLEAGWEFRAVAVFGIAAAQGLDLSAMVLEAPACLAKHLCPHSATSHRVLGVGALAEENASMPPPDGQGLSLAVCREEWPVLGLQGCDLLLGRIALVLAEHRLP